MKIKKHSIYHHHYDNWAGHPAKCLIDIFELKNPTRPEGYDKIVLFRELQDNQGVSITSYSENLAQWVLNTHNWKFENCVFIEGYPMYFDKEGEHYNFIIYKNDDFGLSSLDWTDLERHSKKLFDFIRKNASEYPLDRVY